MVESGTGHVFSSRLENKTTRPVMVRAEYRTILGDRAPSESLTQFIQPGQARTFNRKRTKTNVRDIGELDMFIDSLLVVDGNDSNLSTEQTIRTERDQDRRDYDILEAEDLSFVIHEK